MIGKDVATTPANPSTACAMVIADELMRNGVREVIVAPGSRSAALANAMDDLDGLRVHVQLDERSAGFVALGIARQTGRPAAVVTTSGSAVANLHPAVVEADSGQIPLLLLTADRPPELRNTGANQTIDQVGLFGHAARWAVDLAVAENRADAVAMWRSTVCRALAAATGSHGPPGPVQINIGFREPTVPVVDDGRSPPAAFDFPIDGRPGAKPWIDVTSGRWLPDDALDDLAQRLVQYPHGIIIVGQFACSVVRAGQQASAITQLAQALQWPVLAEPGPVRAYLDSTSTIAHGHHLTASQAFVTHNKPAFVLRIGRLGTSPALERFLQSEVLTGTDQLLIDEHASWHDPTRTLSGIVASDVVTTCQRLATTIDATSTRSQASGWLEHWKAADAHIDAALADLVDAGELSEPAVARTVVRALAPGDAVVAGSSMPIRDVDRYVPAGTGVDVVANRGVSGIDGTVSTALGVGLARQDGRVVGLAGDLTMLHDTNGFLLSTTDDVRLDVTFVVIDNNGGGIFSFLPQATFVPRFERLFGTPHDRNFEHYARLHNVSYHHAATVSELQAAMHTTGSGLHLVHVRTDRASNLTTHRDLDQAVLSIVDGLVYG